MVFRVNGDAVDSGGPEDRLLPWDRVHDMTGLSRSTAWRLSKAEQFPSRVAISPGRVGWWESELTAWKAVRNGAEAINPPPKPMRSRPLEPPARPRLPGISRPAPFRSVQGPLFAAAQPELPMSAPQPPREKARRKRPPAHIDQIDFGF